jgi:hypothetical protein
VKVVAVLASASLAAVGFHASARPLTTSIRQEVIAARDWNARCPVECRQASASPCTSVANRSTGSWSEHAYGEAVDLNPVENPYVGCGMTRDKRSRPYLDRAQHRRGMVTPTVVGVFEAVGWGWGGNWSGSTKDYMHFSATGH